MVSRPEDQPKPDFDLGTYLPYYLAHILHRYDSNMAADLARHGLNNSSWRVISTLDFRDGLTIKELSQYTVLERSFVSRIVAKLEQRGFVSRHVLEEDRRNVIVQLTAEGRQVLQNVMLPVVTEHLALALKGAGRKEQTLLLETLSKIMDNVYRAARSTPPDLRFQ